MGEQERFENGEGGSTVFTDASFKTFMSGTVIAFLVSNNLQSVTVDDGCGHKGTASVTSKGEYKVQRTSTELM